MTRIRRHLLTNAYLHSMIDINTQYVNKKELGKMDKQDARALAEKLQQIKKAGGNVAVFIHGVMIGAKLVSGRKSV